MPVNGGCWKVGHKHFLSVWGPLDTWAKGLTQFAKNLSAFRCVREKIPKHLLNFINFENFHFNSNEPSLTMHCLLNRPSCFCWWEWIFFFREAISMKHSERSKNLSLKSNFKMLIAVHTICIRRMPYERPMASSFAASESLPSNWLLGGWRESSFTNCLTARLAIRETYSSLQRYLVTRLFLQK